MRKKAWTAAICLLLLFSCADKKPQVVTEVVEGVEYVHNPSTPLQPGKKVVFEPDLIISGEDDDGNIIVYRPSRLAVSPEGMIFLSDAQERKIHVFDSGGRHVLAFGKQGKGPGEFERMGPMMLLPDGRLLVIDWLAQRTSFFTPEGQYLGGHPWRTRHYELLWCDADSYAMDERIFAGEETTLKIKTYSLEGEELLSFGEFTPDRPHLMTTRELSFAISVPYSPHSVFAADRSRNRLFHCLNSRYVIEVYDGEAHLIRRIDRPYTPLPFTDEDRQAYYDDVDRNPNKVFAKMARDVKLPDTKTVTENMIVDDLGNLWVRTFEKKMDGEKELAAYDIFNSKGEYMTRIWTDILPLLFQGGRMYSFNQSEEGYSTLIRYSVKWTD